MTKLSEKAFAIMAVCPETKKFYGITVDEVRRNAYKFVWAFPIEKEKAHREGYDSTNVHGSIEPWIQIIPAVLTARASNIYSALAELLCAGMVKE